MLLFLLMAGNEPQSAESATHARGCVQEYIIEQVSAIWTYDVSYIAQRLFWNSLKFMRTVFGNSDAEFCSPSYDDMSMWCACVVGQEQASGRHVDVDLAGGES